MKATLTITASVLLFISCIFVATRVYVRFFLMKSAGYDDFLLLIALALFTTYCSFIIISNVYGLGANLYDLSLEDIPSLLKYGWLSSIFYCASTAVLRLAIGVFLLRLGPAKKFAYTIYISLFLATIFSLFFMLITIFQCSPVSYFWDTSSGEGHCITAVGFLPNVTIAQTVVYFCADWILGLIPIPILWHVQMPRPMKISIAGILALALMASIVVIIKLPYLIKIVTRMNDVQAVEAVVTLSMLEPTLGFIAASATVFRPLMRSLFPNFNSHPAKQTPTYPINNSTPSGTNNYQNHTPRRRSDDTDELRLNDDTLNRTTTNVSSSTQQLPMMNQLSRPDAVQHKSENGTWQSLGGITVRNSFHVMNDVELGGIPNGRRPENKSSVPNLDDHSRV